jgi:hypothetical protein
MIPTDEQNGRVTLRDLARVEQAQEKILAEIKQLATKVDAKFDAHAAKHEAERESHDIQHGTERKERRGLLLWAVTTVMTGAGTLLAIYVAFRGP